MDDKSHTTIQTGCISSISNEQYSTEEERTREVRWNVSYFPKTYAFLKKSLFLKILIEWRVLKLHFLGKKKIQQSKTSVICIKYLSFCPQSIILFEPQTSGRSYRWWLQLFQPSLKLSVNLEKGRCAQRLLIDFLHKPISSLKLKTAN